MKYFFLSENWIVGRVWGTDGLWNEAQWRRKPQIEPLPLTMTEQGEQLRLYRTEPAVLMVEVKPQNNQVPLNCPNDHSSIGQVVLKRLMSADQAIDRLAQLQLEKDANPRP